MTGYEINVRVDVLGQIVMVGQQLNRSPLSRRHKDGFVNIVATRSNIARCLLRIAGEYATTSPVPAVAFMSVHAHTLPK